MNFAERLKTLPAVTHLQALQLLDAEGHPWERSKAQLCQGQGT